MTPSGEEAAPHQESPEDPLSVSMPRRSPKRRLFAFCCPSLPPPNHQCPRDALALQCLPCPLSEESAL
eukprot:scaffold15475_cov31-Tisochrysis_lutea.AAC.3